MTTAVVEQVKSTIHYSKHFDDTWVDLSNVPLKLWRDKYIYDWRNCTEWLEVPFKYGMHNDILLIKYFDTVNRSKHRVCISFQGCKITMITLDLEKVGLGGLLNLVPISRPDLIQYFSNGFAEARKYRQGYNEKVVLKCPNCKTLKSIQLNNVSNRGFNCDVCFNNASYPERLTECVLKVLGFDYVKQKRFEGSNYRFDFYIPHLKLIVEVHGIQHFKNTWSTREDVSKNDNAKRKFIKFGLGLNYTAIDISQSDFQYGICMLQQSALGDYMNDLDEYKIKEKLEGTQLDSDYNKIIADYENGLMLTELCEKYNRTYIMIMGTLKRAGVYYTVKKQRRKEKTRELEMIVKDYEKGMRLYELRNKYQIDDSTLIQRLKKVGVYKPTKNSESCKTKATICVTTGEVYSSIAEASRQTGSQDNAISRCCKGHVGYKSAGRTKDGRKRIWMYLEDYQEQQNQKLKGAN